MDKAKKNRLKKYITWVCLVALVALLAAMPVLAQREAAADGPVASILEGTVQMGSLETGLNGGGVLTAGNAMDVELPKGVKITEFLVKNGDTVTEGQPVAAVDKVSVMTAIVQVRDSLEHIQSEMGKAKDETAASTIKATAGGRVKQVFAQAGDSVQDVMLRHGALAVLSLDGMMAVSLEKNTDLAAGDTVNVTFSNGTEVSGRVEKNLDGVLVVTVNDKDYAVGEQVTVSGEDGAVLGAGELYVHNAWKAMAFTGTVNTVSARENTDVHAGTALFTLKDTDITGTLDSLASMHREYEELLQKLFTMHETGVIAAPCDGLVSGVDTDSEFLLSGTQAEGEWFVMLLSNVESKCTGHEDCEAEKHESGCAVYCTMLPNCSNENHKTGCLSICTGNGSTCQSALDHEHHQKTCIKRCTGSEGCDALVHQIGCIERCTSSSDNSCPALNHKEDCDQYGVTYTAYAAKITLLNTDKVQVIWGLTQYAVEPDGDGWKLVNPTEIADRFPGVDGVDYNGPEIPEECAVGDLILVVTGSNASGEIVRTEAFLYEKAQNGDTPGGYPGGYPGIGGIGDLSGLLGSLKGMAGLKGSAGQSTGFTFYELEGDVLMTVTEQDVMTLEIALDETDISKVSLGQLAQVKINALKGDIFEAEVTKIGAFGTGNGGSSKFTVELTLPLEEDMIQGMSAVAYIPLHTKMDVLTIPVAALVEDAGRTVVYTALDPETGDPSEPVEVTIGISDGVTAEVLSGLKSGSKYYYSYYDTLELSTEVETEKYSFG